MEGLNMYWSTGGQRCYLKIYDENYVSTVPGETYGIVNLVNEGDELEEGAISLRKDKEYMIGLDMSKTQSGIAILNLDRSVVAMIDLVNRGMTEQTYYSHLSTFFKSNFVGVKLKFVILEEQILTRKAGVKGHAVMSQLQGFMLSMSKFFGT